MDQITYRSLCDTDARSVRNLRLSVLRSDPGTFSITFDQENAVPIEQVEGMLRSCVEGEDCAAWGAFHGGLVGMVGVNRMPGQLQRHKARIWGMYVMRTHRRRGVGQALLVHALDFAKSIKEVEKICIEVTSAARDAIRLYQCVGFEIASPENNALKFGGQIIDGYQMELLI